MWTGVQGLILELVKVQAAAVLRTTPSDGLDGWENQQKSRVKGHFKHKNLGKIWFRVGCGAVIGLFRNSG